MVTLIVALIGRPNVGKSTLFNRLTHTRDALVADFPGLTRDRKYGRVVLEGYEFVIIDTIGIDGTEEGIEAQIAWQSLVAIEEADIVLFMVDGRTGLVAADKGIAKHLRNRQKTTLIVVNKTDGIDADSVISDFYTLGMSKIVPIAASHGHNINNLIKQILLLFVKFESWSDDKGEILIQEKLNKQSSPIKLAIVGRPNVGKSTLTNRILKEERVVVHDMPGTTRDSIYIPMMRNKYEYILIDTAGVRKSSKVKGTIEKFAIIKTFQAIKDANVVLLVVDAYEGIFDQDLSLLSFILNSGRSLVIAANKWDSLSRTIRNDIKKTLYYRLNFVDFTRVHFISALYNYGIDNLFESVNEAYQCATKRMSTALLTRIMHMAVDEHQPPLVRGRRVKPKYAHVGGFNPPIIVIHGTQVKDLPDHYKRYLMKYFRRSLEIIGTPIHIQFNETINPFSYHHNILTPTGFRKQKRFNLYYK